MNVSTIRKEDEAQPLSETTPASSDPLRLRETYEDRPNRPKKVVGLLSNDEESAQDVVNRWVAESADPEDDSQSS